MFSNANRTNTRTTTAIMSVLGPLPSLISLPIAVARARRGDSVSTTLLAAWVAYLTAAVTMVCLVQGLLPVNFWTLHSFQLGAAANMLLFLRVLGQRSAALRHAASEAFRERDTMRSLAYTDSLTGLCNRRGMQMALGDDGGFAADDPVACLNMDLGRVLQVTREPDGGLKAKLARVGCGDLRLRLLSQGAQPLALTKEIVADFHAHGTQVCPWTVDEPRDMQRLIDLCVDGMLTNRIDTVWF